jgi:hypothetical protein
MTKEKQLELPLVGGTCNEPMASQKNSTSRYFKTKKEVAAFVKDLLPPSLDALPLTITIELGKYEGYYVRTVITE